MFRLDCRDCIEIINKEEMAYNPKIHHRRSIRLKGYDYSQAGLYFVTICCEKMMCRFGEVKSGEMVLNEYGEIAYTQWLKLAERFGNFELDVFQIMPNHMHGIIVLNDVDVDVPVADPDFVDVSDSVETPVGTPVGTPLAGVPDESKGVKGAGASPARTTRTGGGLGDIVGAYKSIVANECLKIYKSNGQQMGKLWQRNYYSQ